MKSYIREKSLLYLLLLLLGFALGATYERYNRAPAVFQNTPPPPSIHTAKRSPKFYNLTELKLHEFEEKIKAQKRAYKRYRDKDPAKLQKLLEEMDQTTRQAMAFAQESNSDFAFQVNVQKRCWFLLASGRFEQAQARCRKHLPDNGAFLASQLARNYEHFKRYSDAADLLRQSIQHESDLFYRWERRERLCGVLVKAGDYESAETELDSLQSELEGATQKRQIVGLLSQLWDVREELAKARDDRETERQARAKSHEYHEYWMRLE